MSSRINFPAHDPHLRKCLSVEALLSIAEDFYAMCYVLMN
jgi:hypothetical protein